MWKREDVKVRQEIYFAGGCFWGVQAFFSRVPGVLETESGYANGRTERPTYEDVCRRGTGHAETVRVVYDDGRVDLETLTRLLFTVIDPTSVDRQGGDTGRQYRTGIYYTQAADRPVLERCLAREAARHAAPLATELRPLEGFWRAEDYHQDYLEKNPGGYCHITFGALESLVAGPDGKVVLPRWEKPDGETLRRTLTPIQYAVTQEAETERPFTGAYWDETRPGLYVDVVTGEPLFAAKDKFDAGCGWPSFTRPVEGTDLVEKTDKTHGMVRTEVRSGAGDSHLGHVFPDGPPAGGGLRYCINAAALRFVPKEAMEAEGYGAWLDLV